jgi:hypothetical protein
VSEKIADWALHHVNTTYERSGDKGLRAVSNWKTDGDIEHYGAGFGTLTVEHDMNNPNAKSGSCSWQGEAFLPNGDRLMGYFDGTWEALGGKCFESIYGGLGQLRRESALRR